jgi:hypothetical protein
MRTQMLGVESACRWERNMRTAALAMISEGKRKKCGLNWIAVILRERTFASADGLRCWMKADSWKRVGSAEVINTHSSAY